MEASNVTPSFLCFLPELQCTPTNFLYFNGIPESNGIQQFATKPIPLTLTKTKCSNGTLDLPNRLSNASAEAGSNGTLDLPNKLSNASAEADSDMSNGFVQNMVSVAGNICQGEGVDARSLAASMEESRAEHKQCDSVARTVLQSCDKGEVGIQDTECNGNQDLARVCLEEEDDSAFEITEFFKAFEDGQEHNAMKFREKLSPESLSEPKGNQLGGISKTTSIDGQVRSDKSGMLGNEGSNDGAMYTSSAGRSGKWNGYLEVESFSATFSGPLTFSGPISYSGNLGHVPYSGSVSHRSDSSTASTHSFAFPILPCEWNSSPVKMAQPDQRFTKKPWKRRLRSCFCCADSSS